MMLYATKDSHSFNKNKNCDADVVFKCIVILNKGVFIK